MEMGMATNRYFVASDYDLTLRLQELFHETVALQAKIDNAELKDERIELELKLEKAHNEISQLVKNMKHLLSDTEIAKKPIPLTLSASKRSN
jgi:hypothetical protein